VLARWGHSSVQCNFHRAKHQGCGTRDTLCMIWELWAYGNVTQSFNVKVVRRLCAV
jgi:hypothetical protein